MMCRYCCAYGHRENRCKRDPCCFACGMAHRFYDCQVLLEQDTQEYREAMADITKKMPNK